MREGKGFSLPKPDRIFRRIPADSIFYNTIKGESGRFGLLFFLHNICDDLIGLFHDITVAARQ